MACLGMWIALMPVIAAAYHLPPPTNKHGLSSGDENKYGVFQRNGTRTETGNEIENTRIHEDFSIKDISNHIFVYKRSIIHDNYSIKDLLKDLSSGSLPKTVAMPTEKDMYADYAYSDADKSPPDPGDYAYGGEGIHHRAGADENNYSVEVKSPPDPGVNSDEDKSPPDPGADWYEDKSPPDPGAYSDADKSPPDAGVYSHEDNSPPDPGAHEYEGGSILHRAGADQSAYSDVVKSPPDPGVDSGKDNSPPDPGADLDEDKSPPDPGAYSDADKSPPDPGAYSHIDKSPPDPGDYAYGGGSILHRAGTDENAEKSDGDSSKDGVKSNENVGREDKGKDTNDKNVGGEVIEKGNAQQKGDEKNIRNDQQKENDEQKSDGEHKGNEKQNHNGLQNKKGTDGDKNINTENDSAEVSRNTGKNKTKTGDKKNDLKPSRKISFSEDVNVFSDVDGKLKQHEKNIAANVTSGDPPDDADVDKILSEVEGEVDAGKSQENVQERKNDKQSHVSASTNKNSDLKTFGENAQSEDVDAFSDADGKVNRHKEKIASNVTSGDPPDDADADKILSEVEGEVDAGKSQLKRLDLSSIIEKRSVRKLSELNLNPQSKKSRNRKAAFERRSISGKTKRDRVNIIQGLVKRNVTDDPAERNDQEKSTENKPVKSEANREDGKDNDHNKNDQTSSGDVITDAGGKITENMNIDDPIGDADADQILKDIDEKLEAEEQLEKALEVLSVEKRESNSKSKLKESLQSKEIREQKTTFEIYSPQVKGDTDKAAGKIITYVFVTGRKQPPQYPQIFLKTDKGLSKSKFKRVHAYSVGYHSGEFMDDTIEADAIDAGVELGNEKEKYLLKEAVLDQISTEPKLKRFSRSSLKDRSRRDVDRKNNSENPVNNQKTNNNQNASNNHNSSIAGKPANNKNDGNIKSSDRINQKPHVQSPPVSTKKVSDGDKGLPDSMPGVEDADEEAKEIFEGMEGAADRDDMDRMLSKRDTISQSLEGGPKKGVQNDLKILKQREKPERTPLLPSSTYSANSGLFASSIKAVGQRDGTATSYKVPPASGKANGEKGVNKKVFQEDTKTVFGRFETVSDGLMEGIQDLSINEEKEVDNFFRGEIDVFFRKGVQQQIIHESFGGSSIPEVIVQKQNNIKTANVPDKSFANNLESDTKLVLGEYDTTNKKSNLIKATEDLSVEGEEKAAKEMGRSRYKRGSDNFELSFRAENDKSQGIANDQAESINKTQQQTFQKIPQETQSNAPPETNLTASLIPTSTNAPIEPSSNDPGEINPDTQTGERSSKDDKNGDADMLKNLKSKTEQFFGGMKSFTDVIKRAGELANAGDVKSAKGIKNIPVLGEAIKVAEELAKVGIEKFGKGSNISRFRRQSGNGDEEGTQTVKKDSSPTVLKHGFLPSKIEDDSDETFVKDLKSDAKLIFGGVMKGEKDIVAEGEKKMAEIPIVGSVITGAERLVSEGAKKVERAIDIERSKPESENFDLAIREEESNSANSYSIFQKKESSSNTKKNYDNSVKGLATILGSDIKPALKGIETSVDGVIKGKKHIDTAGGEGSIVIVSSRKRVSLNEETQPGNSIEETLSQSTAAAIKPVNLEEKNEKLQDRHENISDVKNEDEVNFHAEGAEEIEAFFTKFGKKAQESGTASGVEKAFPRLKKHYHQKRTLTEDSETQKDPFTDMLDSFNKDSNLDVEPSVKNNDSDSKEIIEDVEHSLEAGETIEKQLSSLSLIDRSSDNQRRSRRTLTNSETLSSNQNLNSQDHARDKEKDGQETLAKDGPQHTTIGSSSHDKNSNYYDYYGSEPNNESYPYDYYLPDDANHDTYPNDVAGDNYGDYYGSQHQSAKDYDHHPKKEKLLKPDVMVEGSQDDFRSNENDNLDSKPKNVTHVPDEREVPDKGVNVKANEQRTSGKNQNPNDSDRNNTEQSVSYKGNVNSELLANKEPNDFPLTPPNIQVQPNDPTMLDKLPPISGINPGNSDEHPAVQNIALPSKLSKGRRYPFSFVVSPFFQQMKSLGK